MSAAVFKLAVEDISALTPISMLVVDVPSSKQRLKLMTIGVEPRSQVPGVVTGTVRVYGRWIEGNNFALLREIDLAGINGIDIEDHRGDYKQLKLELENVTGSFDFKAVGY